MTALTTFPGRHVEGWERCFTSSPEPGVAVLAPAMAVGCAWGLSRRLVEHR